MKDSQLALKAAITKTRVKTIYKRFNLYFPFTVEKTAGYIPGPGAYQPKLEFDPAGRYFISKLKST